jgi:hypothetical protein
MLHLDGSEGLHGFHWSGIPLPAIVEGFGMPFHMFVTCIDF